MTKRFGILLTLFAVCAVCCESQNRKDEPDTGGATGGFYGSGGTINGGGLYLNLYDAGPFWKVLNPGVSFELGLYGPTPKTRTDGVFSVDYLTAYLLHRGPDRLHKPAVLFLSGGYSGFFTNGHGVNYGGGFMWRVLGPKTQSSTISLEYREYYVPGWGRQPGFRLAYGIGASDK